MTSWIAAELIRVDLVDRVIHVGTASQDDASAFAYRSSDRDGLLQLRKSMYYATTMAEVIETVRSSDQRFAIVGVPCFIKAARLLAEQDAVLKGRLRYFIGLVCGHLKSQYFAQSLAWQLGVDPADFTSIDFRVKNPDRSVGDYDTGVVDSSGEMKVGRTVELVGGNWGHAAFQPNACNFCDDIFAETADVVLGDAWLPQFQDEWRGTNIVVSRNSDIDALMADGARRGEVETMPISADEAAQSQAGNFRHRRLGLAVRLADDLADGLSVPRKRVAPNAKAVGRRRRRLIRQRRRMSELSFKFYEDALQTGKLSAYTGQMMKEISRYERIEVSPFKKAVRWVRRLVGR